MTESNTLDPLDAVLAGRRTADVGDLSVFVDDLVAAYMPVDDLPRSAALTRFTVNGAPSARNTPAPVARRWGKVAATVVGTVAGKVMLGGAVAVAAVGGLHASGTVQVPLLPEVDARDDIDEPASDPDAATPIDPQTSTSPAPTDSGEPAPSPPVSRATDSDAGETSPALPGESSGTSDLTIPAPTVPPLELPDETPPILDEDVLLPGPTLPDTPT